MALTTETARDALRTVQDPELFKDIVTLNMVKDIRIDGSSVRVVVELTTPNCPLKETIQKDVESALLKVGFNHVEIQLTARGAGGTPGGAEARPNLLPQIKHVIAVGAGKGGVGKSTVSVNLAVGLARQGLRVGLFDGDIYGPSMPTMLGIKGAVPSVKDQKILPHAVHGIHAITIGSLVEADQPLIWRGPKAHHAFRQLLSDNTAWPELDYLVVDLPPGTGDVPLTLCQLLTVTGCVVVATPQQVALDDALRAVRMFQQLGTPILGLVENMSYFVAPDGSEHDIFGRGGTERSAQSLGLPYLGAIPMFTDLRKNSDLGTPEANFEENPKLRDALEGIVKTLLGQVRLQTSAPAAPKLTIS